MNPKLLKEMQEELTPVKQQKTIGFDHMQLRSATKISDTSAKKTLVIQPEAPKKRTFRHLTDPEPVESTGTH